jgi:type IV pilus biogenesis protein CpaD/CtpE
MTIKRSIVGAAVLMAVSACTPNDIGMGSAAKHNYAAQIVNPEPVYEEAMVANGGQTAAAQERYRKGTVKKPVGVKTTTGGTSGSSN